MTEKNKPVKKRGNSDVLPPQSSPLDTSNWDEKPFYVTEFIDGIRAPKKKGATKPRQAIYNGPAESKRKKTDTMDKQKNAEPKKTT